IPPCFRRRLALAAVITSLLAAASRTALAEATAAERATAQALFDEGRKLAQAGRFVEACPKFEESLLLDPGIGNWFKLANSSPQLRRARRHGKGTWKCMRPPDPSPCRFQSSRTRRLLWRTPLLLPSPRRFLRHRVATRSARSVSSWGARAWSASLLAASSRSW